MEKYQRFEGESEDELVYRIGLDKEKIGSWKEVSDILNQLLNTNYNESTYRKRFQNFTRMLKANQSKFVDTDSQLKVLNEKIKEYEKAKVKLQTEKVEYARWVREEARDELITEKIVTAIQSLEPLQFPIYQEIKANPKSYVLVEGDEHFGVEFELKGLFGEIINAYSPEIFEKRMYSLLSQTITKIKQENINVLHVFSMGDYCDGILRVSQLMKLRYGVVEGTIRYANFITQWLNELTKYTHVSFYMTLGNHSELRMLNQPKGTFVDENMGKVVSEFIKTRLEGNPNFTFVENPTGYIYTNLVGYPILGLHGEVKNMDATIKDFSKIYGVDIKYLIAGHLHHSRSEEVGIDSTVINIPSIIGVDSYSLSLNKTSNPSAKMLVFEEDRGLTCEYTFKLN